LVSMNLDQFLPNPNLLSSGISTCSFLDGDIGSFIVQNSLVIKDIP
jgi:hypothetical protein